MFRNIVELEALHLPKIPNAEAFTLLIDGIVKKYQISYFEAIMEFCEGTGREYESVVPLLSAKLRTKLMEEASERNLLKDNTFKLDRLG